MLGSGAREHALVKAVAADPEVDAVIAAPGQPGHRRHGPVRPHRHPRRRRGRRARQEQRSTSSSSVRGPARRRRRRRMPSAGSRSSARRRRPPASRAASPSPRRSWPRPTCRRRSRTCARRWTRWRRRSTPSAHPTSSRTTGWLRARASSCTDSRRALAHARGASPRSSGRARRRGVPRRARGLGLLPQRRSSVVAPSPAQDFKRVGDDDAGSTPEGWAPTRHSTGRPRPRRRIVRRVAQPTVERCVAAARPSSACSTWVWP